MIIFFLYPLTVSQVAALVPSFEFQGHMTAEPFLGRLLVSTLT